MMGWRCPLGWYRAVYDTVSEAEEWRQRCLKKGWWHFPNSIKAIHHRSKNINTQSRIKPKQTKDMTWTISKEDIEVVHKHSKNVATRIFQGDTWSMNLTAVWECFRVTLGVYVTLRNRRGARFSTRTSMLFLSSWASTENWDRGFPKKTVTILLFSQRKTHSHRWEAGRPESKTFIHIFDWVWEFQLLKRPSDNST